MKIYLISVVWAMLIVLLTKVKAMNSPKDPFKAMESMQKLIEENPEMEGLINYIIDNPSQCLLLFCICPFLNVVIIISGMIGLLKVEDDK